MRVLRIRQVCEKVGVCRARVYELEREGRFPKRIRLGMNAVGWVESELDQWIAERMAERSPGKDHAEPVAPQG